MEGCCFSQPRCSCVLPSAWESTVAAASGDAADKDSGEGEDEPACSNHCHHRWLLWVGDYYYSDSASSVELTVAVLEVLIVVAVGYIGVIADAVKALGTGEAVALVAIIVGLVESDAL